MANGPTSASWGGEAPLPPHSSVEVTLEYRSYNCGELSNLSADPIPITVTNLFGISLHKAVVPVVFYQGTAGFSIGEADTTTSSRVNWPEALTWSACHRGGASPVPSFTLTH